jgi:hypothetical protein
MTKERDERDFKPLIRNVKAATSAVLERLDIDSIDKNTENQLIHICLNDANCVYGSTIWNILKIKSNANF